LIVTEADLEVSAAEVAVTTTDPRASGVSAPVVESTCKDEIELLDHLTAVFDELLTLAVQVYTGVPFKTVTPRCRMVGQAVIATVTPGVGVGVGAGVGVDDPPPPHPASKGRKMSAERAKKSLFMTFLLVDLP
jgi:hypothetical protein